MSWQTSRDIIEGHRRHCLMVLELPNFVVFKLGSVKKDLRSTSFKQKNKTKQNWFYFVLQPSVCKGDDRTPLLNEERRKSNTTDDHKDPKVGLETGIEV